MKSLADFTVVIMSGNFTQRGNIAVMDKFTRASHAIRAGADLVIELPTCFATSNAEIFTSSAVKLINALGGGILCFGAESGSSDDFYNLAKISLNESAEFKNALKRELSCGQPLAKAKETALRETYPDQNFDILKTPNNILGIEYTKSILRQNANIRIYPILRIGAGYKDDGFNKEFCSASAIRGAIGRLNKEICVDYVPDYVYKDLPNELLDISKTAIFSLLNKSKKSIAQTLDCNEGLENRLVEMSKKAKTFNELIDLVETKRYTRARISRIVTQNMLNITERDIRNALKGGCYFKVLAVNKQRIEVLSLLNSRIDKRKNTFIIRKSDADKLKGSKKKAFAIDLMAQEVYNLISNENINAFACRGIYEEDN